MGRSFRAKDGQLYASSLTSTFLRKLLLFWDELDYPEGDCTERTEDNPDIVYLLEEGVLTRTKTEKGKKRTVIARPEEGTVSPDGIYTGKWPIHAWASSYVMNDTYISRSKEEPGKWSMASMMELPRLEGTEKVPGVFFELYNMLPIPDRTVPLSDILEFRESRYDELLALRGHLDDIYSKIVSSGDIPQSKIAELDRLERSLKVLKRTMDEQKMPVTFSDIKSSIAGEFDLLYSSAIGVGGVAFTSNMSLINAGMTGLGAAGIGFVCKKMVTPKTVDKSNPFL